MTEIETNTLTTVPRHEHQSMQYQNSVQASLHYCNTPIPGRQWLSNKDII